MEKVANSTSELFVGMSSPDERRGVPVNPTSVAAESLLSAAISNGVVNITWSGSPYVLQETTDLSSGVWVNSVLPFTQSVVNSNIVTTAIAAPATGGPSKFYRLIFRP